MSYGPPKYTVDTIREAIGAFIAGDLKKSAPFNNNSLSYYGIHFEYTIKLTLVARADQDLTIHGAGDIGTETPHEPIPDPQPGEPATAPIETATEEHTLEGSTSVGARPNREHEGHTRERNANRAARAEKNKKQEPAKK